MGHMRQRHPHPQRQVRQGIKILTEFFKHIPSPLAVETTKNQSMFIFGLHDFTGNRIYTTDFVTIAVMYIFVLSSILKCNKY